MKTSLIIQFIKAIKFIYYWASISNGKQFLYERYPEHCALGEHFQLPANV